MQHGAYLLEQSSLLDDIGHCLHLDAFGLVDILERIEGFGLLVLNNANLTKGSFANASQEIEVEEVDFRIEVNSLEGSDKTELLAHLWFTTRCSHGVRSSPLGGLTCTQPALAGEIIGVMMPKTKVFRLKNTAMNARIG